MKSGSVHEDLIRLRNCSKSQLLSQNHPDGVESDTERESHGEVLVSVALGSGKERMNGHVGLNPQGAGSDSTSVPVRLYASSMSSEGSSKTGTARNPLSSADRVYARKVGMPITEAAIGEKLKVIAAIMRMIQVRHPSARFKLGCPPAIPRYAKGKPHSHHGEWRIAAVAMVVATSEIATQGVGSL